MQEQLQAKGSLRAKMDENGNQSSASIPRKQFNRAGEREGSQKSIVEEDEKGMIRRACCH